MSALQNRAAAIAVAPLRSSPSDPERARLAQGLLEDVVAELARFADFEVLAARTSFALSGDALEPDQLARRFGVTHLLDTAVSGHAEELQIRVSLISTNSARQLWSERYQVPLSGVMAVPDAIASQVVSRLTTQIQRARLAGTRRKPLTSFSAYDCWLRGQACLRRGTLDADAEAREYFERALSIDPSYARAYAGLSLSHFNEWSCQRWSEWDQNERLAYEYACKSVELDQTDHVVHAVLSRVHAYRRDFGQARAHLERVLTLCPNDADVLAQVALLAGYLGERERSVELLEKGLRLNPLHDESYYAYGVITYFLARRLDAALAMAEAAPDDMFVDQSAFMAAAYAHRGDRERAKACVAGFLRAFQDKITFGRPPEPDEPLRFVLQVNPFAREADVEYLLEGLRLAGLESPPPRPGAYLPQHADEEHARFERQGDLWVVAFGPRTVHIPDMKGCGDLALLLASAQQRIHCLELAGRMAEGHAGAALDARARAECQRRIRDLHEELAQAEADHDLGRQEALHAAYSALTEQLSDAFGLGGRSRKLGDPAEKARSAVTWRIRNAIKKIGQAHPELGRHLQVSVRTGTFCAYSPDRRVSWSV